MVMVAVLDEGHPVVWLALLFASAGVFHHAGIKIPFFAFFAHDSGIRTPEPPLNMLIAMSIAAILCVFIGSYPWLLYSLLPFEVNYVPFDRSHVLAQFQLLVFSAAAFAWLKISGIYPPELHATNIDVEWFYRRLAPRAVRESQPACLQYGRRCRTCITGLQQIAHAIGISALWSRRHVGAYVADWQHGPLGGGFTRRQSSRALLPVRYRDMIFKFIKNRLTRGADSEAAASRDRASRIPGIAPSFRLPARALMGGLPKEISNGTSMAKLAPNTLSGLKPILTQSKRSATPLLRPSASLMSNWLVGANPTMQRGRGFNSWSMMFQQPGQKQLFN